MGKPMRDNYRHGKEKKRLLPCDDTPMPKCPRLNYPYNIVLLVSVD